MACRSAAPEHASPGPAAPLRPAAPKLGGAASSRRSTEQLAAQALLAASGGRELLRCALGGAEEAPQDRGAAGVGSPANLTSPAAGTPTWQIPCEQHGGPGHCQKPAQIGLSRFDWAAGGRWVVSTPSAGHENQRTTGSLQTVGAAACIARSCGTAPGPAALPPAVPSGLGLPDLPGDVLQTVVDWLPTFHERVRCCRAAKAMRRLDWRWSPPLQLEEELGRMTLGDRGAAAVAITLSCPLSRSLGELSLEENGIGDAGACAIARALGAGAGIRRLSLRDNAIGDVGAEALAEALSRSTTIEEVDLWGNQISDAGKAAIQRMARCDAFLEVDPVRPVGAGSPSADMGKIRSVLFEWIAQVHSGVQMPPAFRDGPADPQDMLFRTYRHVDAYVAHRPVQRTELQLAAVASTLLASGYRAEHCLEDDLQVSSWVSMVTDGTCTIQEVQSMLGQVLGALGFGLLQPTPYTFLRRLLRRTGWTEQSFSLANYLIELAALDSAFLAFRPQAVAAAACVLSRQYAAQGVSVRRAPRWKAKLLQSAHVELEAELAGCIASLASLHRSKQPEVNNFVNRKYSVDALHSVASITPNMPVDASYYVGYMTC